MHTLRHTFIFLTLAMGLWGQASADAPVQPRSNLPSYKQECATCHMAYPPGMMTAQTWQRVMGSLPKHYGTDASIDDVQVLKNIASWLQSNAGTYKRAEDSPSGRMTETAWFERKHRKVDDEVWKRVEVKSKSNCIACHRGAEVGDFEDHAVRIPGGGGKSNTKSKR